MPKRETFEKISKKFTTNKKDSRRVRFYKNRLNSRNADKHWVCRHFYFSILSLILTIFHAFMNEMQDEMQDENIIKKRRLTRPPIIINNSLFQQILLN